MNALAGLCKAGEAGAVDRLKRLAISPDASVRKGTVWAMGALENPEFAPVNATLEQDADHKARAMAVRCLKAPPVEQLTSLLAITSR
jgi:HEAT repeat protein